MAFIKFHCSSRGPTINILLPLFFCIFSSTLRLAELCHTLSGEIHFHRWIYDITNCIKLNSRECEKNSNERDLNIYISWKKLRKKRFPRKIAFPCEGRARVPFFTTFQLQQQCCMRFSSNGAYVDLLLIFLSLPSTSSIRGLFVFVSQQNSKFFNRHVSVRWNICGEKFTPFFPIIPARNKKKNFRFLVFLAFVGKFKNSIGRNVNKATWIDIWVFTAKEFGAWEITQAYRWLRLCRTSHEFQIYHAPSSSRWKKEGHFIIPNCFVPTSWPWTLSIFHFFSHYSPATIFTFVFSRDTRLWQGKAFFRGEMFR